LESCERTPRTWLRKASEIPIESIDILEYVERRMLSWIAQRAYSR
jgi:hypothetical protein